MVVVGQDQRGAYALRGAEGELYDRHFAIDQLKVVRGIEFKEQFIVEKILNDRQGLRGTEYLVKRKIYGDDQNTWEPLSMLNDGNLIEAYHRSKEAGAHPSLGIRGAVRKVRKRTTKRG